ncbi:MAG TPA: PKD domain-containing protein [Gemmatimonadales bacterium]|nr:PKD domain-containing protein [Gemmatimonadales bacterium]
MKAAHVLIGFAAEGRRDTLTAELDWGDGDTVRVDSGVVASHRYAAVGQYLVRLGVRNDDGLTATQNAPNPIVIYDPTVDQANPAGYEVIDLGTLGGSGAIPRALNDAGQVVGCSQTGDGTWHAFVWSEGNMRDLGSGAVTSCAWAINKSGRIAGVAGSTQPEAVLAWSSNAQPIGLGAPPCCDEAVGFVGVTEGTSACNRTSSALMSRLGAAALRSQSISTTTAPSLAQVMTHRASSTACYGKTGRCK